MSRSVLIILGLWLAPALVTGHKPPANPVQARVSFTGLFYTEHEIGVPPGVQPVLASPTDLLFGDLRLELSATQLAKRVDLHLDVRERFTGSFDFERKFTDNYFATASNYRSARGYLGGREHDLRQAWVGLRVGRQTMLMFGRMVIREADALKIDGARIRMPWGEHWEVSAFFGGYPNPYSRSLFSDYIPPCGAGVASGGSAVINLGPLGQSYPGGTLPIAPDPCRSAQTQLSLAGGLAARYRYSRFAGQLGLVGALLGGLGDGGPVLLDPVRPPDPSCMPDRAGNLQPADICRRDAPRFYLNWQNQLPQLGPVELFTDLVVDLHGSHGPQLTRALAVASIHLLPKQRMTLRTGYTYLSSVAIDQFLRLQLYNRAPNGTTLDPRDSAGIVENNLTVVRTARQEARVSVDATLYKQWSLWAEGRFRHRSLLGGERNPQVFRSPLYTDQVRTLAYDATLGVRNSGLFSELRLGATYTFLRDFRAQNHLFRISLGRPLARERITLEGDYLLLATRDDGVGKTACANNLNPPLGQDYLARLDPRQSLFAADCFGRRRGLTHELGVTATAIPWRHLVILADYRVTLVQTDPQAGVPIPTLLGHSLWLRLEIGF